ncbi:MAG TPA: Rrf2 family transcriptional regulator [Acidimicrobiales bacterium]|nr:Rrf2 family transcriptional regulator [Acidimicrobiales bacterium]
MQVTAKADYAVRAMIEIAARDGVPVKGDVVAESQHIPPAFLESILSEMRQAGLLHSRRGPEGGYWLARPAERITVADVVRAADGPLALVRGDRPETVRYAAPATRLADVWVAVRASLRAVLEEVTLAAILARDLPQEVVEMLHDPGADRRR